jgi:hypothetical protein
MFILKRMFQRLQIYLSRGIKLITHRITKLLVDFIQRGSFFYGQELGSEQSVLKKTSLLRATPDFHQELIGEITLKQYDSGIIKCEFIKEVTSNAKVYRYPSYLLLRNISDELYIYGESDDITDRNLHYALNIGNVLSTQEIPAASNESGGYLYQFILIGFGVLVFIGIVVYRRRSSRGAVEHVLKNEEHVEEKVKLGEEKMERNEGDSLESKSIVSDNEIDYAQKGLEFEKYVVSKFDKNYFTLIHWRSDKGSNGIYAESNGYPDLEYKFQHHLNIRQFAVECKYRQSFTSRGTITIAKDYQIKKYKAFQNQGKMNVYIVLGTGGQPANPLEWYLIPLNEITSNEMHEVELIRFRKTANSRFFYDSNADRLT